MISNISEIKTDTESTNTESKEAPSVAKDILNQALRMIPACSDDATRFHMTGVFINSESDKVTLAATNGHALAEKIYRKDAYAFPVGRFMLFESQAKMLKIILKDDFKYTQSIPCELTPQGLQVGFSSGARVLLEKEATAYPDYKNVIPNMEGKPRVSIAFNADYLIMLAKAIANDEMRLQKNHAIRIEFDPTQPNNPILIFSEDSHEESLGVLMPRRLDKCKDIAAVLSEKLNPNPYLKKEEN